MVIGDREDFDFGFTFDFLDGKIVKLNAGDEIVAAWAIDDAPWEFLRDALEWNDDRLFDDSVSLDALRKLARQQFEGSASN